jgi:hypothetical protein
MLCIPSGHFAPMQAENHRIQVENLGILTTARFFGLVKQG